MSNAKEFQGKTLDEAIAEACSYYGVAREKLEIDIVQDAKGGIFGLVGARKARILASKVSLTSVMDTAVDAAEKTAATAAAASRATPPVPAAVAASEKAKGAEERAVKPASGKERGKTSDEKSRAPQAAEGKPGENRRSARPAKETGAKENGRKPRGERKAAPERSRPPKDENRFEGGPELPEFDLASCDQEAVAATVREIVGRLVSSIVGEAACEVAVGKDKIRISIDCGESSGLLVGREGQTLASVQYLASRMAARALGGSVRLQIDAGNYRERQEDKLRDLALSLAEKVKASGKAQSTRPLTAYQRRVIHLALEGDEAVQTHSKGDGPQRRVVVLPARKE